MIEKRRLPPTASVAHESTGARLISPAAERNSGPIVEILLRHAPRKGKALELASGTGQHVVAFARALPDLIWQPSEIDTRRRASIDEYAKDADLPNLRPAVAIDATAAGWHRQHSDQSLVVLVNLLHLISAAEARVVIGEAAAALAPGGLFALYGPFLRAGRTTSEADERFHESLVASDPQIGYKDIGEVAEWICETGLVTIETCAMPANNLLLISGRPQEADGRCSKDRSS